MVDTASEVVDKTAEVANKGANAAAEATGNGRRHYAMVANVCSSYPALGKASECKIINSENSFPRTINCKFELILQRGMEFTVEIELSIGLVPRDKQNS